jgi:hypothetical protein
MMKKVAVAALAVLLAGPWVSSSATGETGLLTVTALAERGVQHLDDVNLEELIVGKSLVIRNRSTGEYYEAAFGADGMRQLRNITARRLGIESFESLHGGPPPPEAVPYTIRDGKIITTFDDRIFEARVYEIDGRYLAAHSTEGGIVNWEVVEAQSPGAIPDPLTESELAAQGVEALDDAALRTLIVGRTLVVRNRATGERYEARYGADGRRLLRNITPGILRQSAFEAFHGGPPPVASAPYVVHDARITTSFDGQVFEVRVYNVGGTYLGARTADQGAVNWELVDIK